MARDDGPSVLAKVVSSALKPRESALVRRDELRQIEQGIIGSALEVVSSTLDFAEIEPDDESPPQRWVDELGCDAAMRKFRIAKEGWKGAKDAAVGIKVATQIAAASLKANAMVQSAQTLNVALIAIAQPPQTPQAFEEVIVDGHGE